MTTTQRGLAAAIIIGAMAGTPAGTIQAADSRTAQIEGQTTDAGRTGNGAAPRTQDLDRRQPVRPTDGAQARAIDTLGRLPLRFEMNRGQFDAETRFAARGLGYGLSLGAADAILSLQGKADTSARLRMSLVGARPDPIVTGVDPLPGVVHHYRGTDPTAWRTGVQAFARVRYAQVYDGIDLVYYGSDQQRLEYDFEIAPGRDPHAIRVRFDGATRLDLDAATGDLLLRLANGETIRQHRPLSYQTIAGVRRVVNSRYVQHADGSVGVEVGAYDRSAPLTIDPVILYSTIFGGTSEETIYDIALDPAGNIYVTGLTQDNPGFPTTPGALDTTRSGNSDAFVSKFNPAGSALIYSTFLGGSADENQRALHPGRIAVDAAGNAYVAGETSSTDFPITAATAYDTSYDDALSHPSDVFYVKLGPTGALLYGTYIGGNTYEYATGIAVDSAGNVYVSGATNSTEATFPQTPNAYNGVAQPGDMFLSKFNAAGVRIYSTFFGGFGTENHNLYPGGLAIDDAGVAYITGSTYATAATFPIVNGAQTTFGGEYDVFVAKIDTTLSGGASLVYSSYLGGNGWDFPCAIAYAGAGQVVVAGQTVPNFPIKNAFQPTYGGGNSDGFIARFDTTKTGADSLLFSTYLGGSTNDVIWDVALDTTGSIHIVGNTNSANFPQVDAVSTLFFLSQPFVAKLNASASTLLFSSFFGGQTNGQILSAVATNARGDTFVAGGTNTSRTNPPLADGHPLVNPIQTTYGGGDRDAVIARIGIAPNPNDTDEDALPNDWESRFGLDPNDGSGNNGRNGDPDGDGRTNEQEYGDGSHPRGFVITYLAEGATGPFFDTRIAVANPTNGPALVLSRFQRDDGTVVPLYTPVAPHSRATIDVDTVSTMENTTFSSLIEADVQVVADRTMTWDAGGFGSHAERGILTRSATEWYLAEGATHGFFSLFYLLQNPGGVAANVEISYLRLAPNSPIVRTYVVPPSSRMTIPVDDEPGLSETDVSASLRSTNGVPFIAERAMYFSRPDQSFAAGHESAGVTAAATRWFLAEGATGSFFNTFVLIANPSLQQANVEMQYLLTDGQVVTKTHLVAAQSRLTINVADEAPILASANMSTVVTSTNSVPIVVERAMWWPATGGWYEAHNSPGEVTTGVHWGLAEGESGGPSGKQTYILIANTSTVAGQARVTLLFEDGSTADKVFDLPPNSRTNVGVAAEFAGTDGRRYGALVESLGASPVALVVERAMYSNANGIVWAAGTNALATKLQ